MTGMENVIPLRPVQPPAVTVDEVDQPTRDERMEICREQWKRARTRHLQLTATVASRGLLRLHNAGRLPGEPGKPLDITPPMISGLRRELQEIADLAKDAADALTTMERALRGKP